jgi:hypothetical protein
VVICPAQTVNPLVVGRKECNPDRPGTISSPLQQHGVGGGISRVEAVWRPFLLSPPKQSLKLARRPEWAARRIA